MKIDWQRFETFCQGEIKRFLWQILTNIPTNIPVPDHLDKLLAHLQCFVQRAKKYMCSVHCLVNSICWCSCICLTLLLCFNPLIVTFFFFCFPPPLAIGYFAGKDQLCLVSKVFLINLKLELDQRKEDGRDSQIACSALVSSPSNRQPYNKHL